MDFAFVLDVSGSMEADRKLQLSTDAAEQFIDALGPDDRFEVLTFNHALVQLFGDFSAADEAGKTEAQTFLDSQRARGGTRRRPAFEAAYRYAQDPDRALNVAARCWLTGRLPEVRWSAGVLLLAFVGKTWLEVMLGHALFAVGGFVNLPLEHAAGAVVGVLVAISAGRQFPGSATVRRAEPAVAVSWSASRMTPPSWSAGGVSVVRSAAPARR